MSNTRKNLAVPVALILLWTLLLGVVHNAAYISGYEDGFMDMFDDARDFRIEQTLYTGGGYVNQTIYNMSWYDTGEPHNEPTLDEDNFVVFLGMSFLYRNSNTSVRVSLSIRTHYYHPNSTIERIVVYSGSNAIANYEIGGLLQPEFLNCTFYRQATVIFFGYGQIDDFGSDAALYGSTIIKINNGWP